jgi:cytoskeleton protein RodZ
MKTTIGQRLKQAREARHLSLEKASEVTRIRTHYLQALEADDFSVMPSPVQGRGFLRLYADYLGLDVDTLVEEMRRTQTDESDVIEPVHTEQTLPQPVPLSKAELQPEAESAVEETAGREPFWVNWLRRRKNEDAVPESPATSEGTNQPREPQTESLVDESASLRDEPTHSEEPEAEPESVTDTARGQNAVAAEPEALPELSAPVWQSWQERLHNLRKGQQTAATAEPEPPHEIPEAKPEPVSEETVAPPAQIRSSDEIFAEIGGGLRQRRELLSLTLDEVEQHTRVRKHYLQALEAGDFEEIPSPVQTRGMLSNYASFLDMDVDTVLLEFAEGLQRWHAERHPELSAEPKPASTDVRHFLPRIRTFIATDLIFGVGMVVLLLAFAIWGAGRIIKSQQAEVTPEATGPSISDVLLITPTLEALETATSATSQPNAPLGDTTLTALAPSEAAPANVTLYVVARERTYMRVSVDGKVVFDGRVVPGNSYPYEANESIEILTGNAAALQVVYNQRDLGLMGNFGEVVDLVYTAQGVQTPTPLPPPTETPTPRFSPVPTRTPSATPTSTSTRLPTATSISP